MKREKGITLIVLIITIIIMLILVAVTIDLAINDDIFNKAESAVDQTNDKVNQTQTRVNELMGIMKEVETEKHNWVRGTGENRDKIECTICSKVYHIGDEVNYTMKGATVASTTISNNESGCGDYTVSRDADTSWIVLGVEDKNGDGKNENLLLTTSKPTENGFKLVTEYAYNAMNKEGNLLNKICKELYGEEARGMTIEDVNNCLQYVPEGGMIYCKEFGSNEPHWAMTDNLTTKLKDLGEIWDLIEEYHEEECDGMFYTPAHPEGIDDGGAELGNYELNGYWYAIDNNNPLIIYNENGDEKEISEKEHNIIFGANREYYYWLASNCVYTNGEVAWFGPYCVLSACVGVQELYFGCMNSAGNYGSFYYDYDFSIRPVVSLSAETPEIKD